MASTQTTYRGRIAPSPTGYLHAGHAQTFWTAQQRALERNGTLILRNENLDPDRCRPEFVEAMMEDLRWFGLNWQEGPDIGGPCAPYNQSQAGHYYAEAFLQLRDQGYLYPCYCSRRDIRNAISAPHQGDEEPLYPGTCRPNSVDKHRSPQSDNDPNSKVERSPSWRFLVPDGKVIAFKDHHYGEQRSIAGRDFGDFVVWRHDDVPSYQLAVVVDDMRMRITEVVRGADLLISTARQLLIYEALGKTSPEFYHCPLVKDRKGERLAKRHEALSLRKLRERGITPERLRQQSESMTA